MCVQYIPPFAPLCNAAVWYGAAERLNGSEVKEGERSQGVAKGFWTYHIWSRGVWQREAPLKADMAPVKLLACPPLTSRKVALLQEPGWVSGSVLGGGRGGGGRKAAPHSFAHSKYVSKGTVAAELCMGLSVGAESQSQTSPDFLSPSFYTRPPAMAFPALGDSSKSPEWLPWDRSEINSRLCQCSSF